MQHQPPSAPPASHRATPHDDPIPPASPSAPSHPTEATTTPPPPLHKKKKQKKKRKKKNKKKQKKTQKTQKQPAPLPDITNHYTLFPTTLPSGPPPSGPFAIPLPSLRREFLHLQSQHHPDKYPTEPAHSKALALSALINTSYKTLSDPLLRAQYLLLTKYDIDVMTEDNSSHATDQGTLLEVMEAQEMIEEATGHAQIEALLEANRARMEETMAKMADAFERGDGEAAKDECVRLKYWRSLQDGLKDWEPGKEVRLVH